MIGSGGDRFYLGKASAQVGLSAGVVAPGYYGAIVSERGAVRVASGDAHGVCQAGGYGAGGRAPVRHRTVRSQRDGLRAACGD